MSKHFIVYFPDATASGDTRRAELEQKFGISNVYQLNGSGAYVLKVPVERRFQQIMDTIGFNNEQRHTGVLVEFNNTNINGWYSQALWDFISQDIANE